MALYRRRLFWRLGRRPPRPAGGEAASTQPLRPSALACGMSQACATSSPPSRSARALHRAEDIGSALKGGVNVCQRQLINEVLGPLVTQFVGNFGREGATPIQRGPNASLFGRVHAVKLIRHNALRLLGAVKPVKRRFFLFWHHGCSAARNLPACKSKSLRCLRKCRFSYIDTSPALSARRHLRAALRYSACPPHRPSCLDLDCQTHRTWRAPRHHGAASSPNWSPVQNFCRELRLQS